jgi:hypothetical protein
MHYINYSYKLYFITFNIIVRYIPQHMIIYLVMENSIRKCIRCRKILESSYYIGEMKTCNTCLETS